MVNWKQNVHRYWKRMKLRRVCRVCMSSERSKHTTRRRRCRRRWESKNKKESDAKRWEENDKKERKKKKKSKIPDKSTYTRVWVLENAKPMSMPTASTPFNVRTRFVRTNAQCAYGLNSKRFIFSLVFINLFVCVVVFLFLSSLRVLSNLYEIYEWQRRHRQPCRRRVHEKLPHN